MPELPLSARPAHELAGMIASRAISPVELVQSCIASIEQLNPLLNAVVTLDRDGAIAAAKKAEACVIAGEETGVLHGLPTLIKDITETAGIRTTYASHLFADNIPDKDAEVVARLKRAGAIILGKTNTPEFAAGANTVNDLFGATLNPWNTKLSPAGSSGGSAVAVASGMVPFAHGTDFGASLRLPAAFCGIVGLRTTPGLIPNAPMPLPWDPGQVHGPLARTAEDAAFMLDGMTGFDPMWPISVPHEWQSAFQEVAQFDDVSGLRIAFAPDLSRIGVDKDIQDSCRQSALALEKEGAIVEEVDFDVSEGIGAYLTLRAEWMVGQQYHNLDRLEALDANLAGNVKEGLALNAKDIAGAQRVRHKVLDKYRMLFERFDLLLTPISPILPFPIAENFPREIGGRKLDNYAEWMAPAFLITLVSLVAASVPTGLSSSGLPFAAQIVGPRLSETRVLSLAKIIQRLCPIRRPENYVTA